MNESPFNESGDPDSSGAAARGAQFEPFLQAILDNLPDMVFMKDAQELRFVYMNPAGERMIGLPASELLGKTDYDFFPRDQADFFQARDRETLRNRRMVDIEAEELKTRTGEIRYLHTKKIPVCDHAGEPYCLLGISRDITETVVARRRQEKLEREQPLIAHIHNPDLLLRALIENIPDIIFLKDADSLDYVYINPAYTDLMGYPAESLIGRNDADLYPAGEAAVFMQFDRQALADGFAQIRGERATTRSGVVRYFNTRKWCIRDAEDRPRYLLGISEDVTRAKVEADYIRNLFDNSPAFMCVAGFDGFIMRTNAALERHVGMSGDQLAARPFMEFIHPEDRVRVENELRKARQGLAASLVVEFRCLRGDGSYTWISWNVGVSAEDKSFFCVGYDITDRITLETHITDIQTEEQRRLSIDLHDSVGQSMTGIALKAKLLAEDPAVDEPHRKALNEIVYLANHASEQARSMSRSMNPMGMEKDLVESLRVFADSMSASYGTVCSLSLDGACPLLDQRISTHLFRIVQEAVSNAIRHGKPRTVRIGIRGDDRAILLQVEDDGDGTKLDVDGRHGYGIQCMKYRARMIGASLDISTNQAGGVTVRCELPLSGGAPVTAQATAG